MVSSRPTEVSSFPPDHRMERDCFPSPCLPGLFPLRWLRAGPQHLCRAGASLTFLRLHVSLRKLPASDLWGGGVLASAVGLCLPLWFLEMLGGWGQRKSPTHPTEQGSPEPEPHPLDPRMPFSIPASLQHFALAKWGQRMLFRRT